MICSIMTVLYEVTTYSSRTWFLCEHWTQGSVDKMEIPLCYYTDNRIFQYPEK